MHTPARQCTYTYDRENLRILEAKKYERHDDGVVTLVVTRLQYPRVFHLGAFGGQGLLSLLPEAGVANVRHSGQVE